MTPFRCSYRTVTGVTWRRCDANAVAVAVVNGREVYLCVEHEHSLIDALSAFGIFDVIPRGLL